MDILIVRLRLIMFVALFVLQITSDSYASDIILKNGIYNYLTDYTHLNDVIYAGPNRLCDGFISQTGYDKRYFSNIFKDTISQTCSRMTLNYDIEVIPDDCGSGIGTGYCYQRIDQDSVLSCTNVIGYNVILSDGSYSTTINDVSEYSTLLCGYNPFRTYITTYSSESEYIYQYKCNTNKKLNSLEIEGILRVSSETIPDPYQFKINGVQPDYANYTGTQIYYHDHYSWNGNAKWTIPLNVQCGSTFTLKPSSKGLGELLSFSMSPVYETCDIKINTLTGTSKILNSASGGNVGINGSITDSSGQPINWTLNILDQAFTGSGTPVNATWNGKYANGTVVQPGSYSATLTAQTADGQCSDSKTVNFTVTPAPDGQCGLYVQFGSSANMASGNLSHSQDLFSSKGGALPAGLTLYYNSLDPHNGR